MLSGLALASMVSQIGCLVIVLIAGTLLAGLWVDKLANTRPLFTIVLLLMSMPVSLFISVRMALSTAARLAPPPKASKDSSSEEDKSSEEG
jgi:F0F1-type ATP synthase assembly protein I